MKILTIGEILIRFTPEQNLLNSSQYLTYIGGGEYNTISYLSNFGYDTAMISVVSDNHLGKRVLRHMKANNVSTKWVKTDGTKQGMYFVDPAHAKKPAEVIYDRLDSSFCNYEFDLVEIKNIIKNYDVLHLSGITPALNEKKRQLILFAIDVAHECGLKISYDSNYRAKLWSQTEAGSFLKVILPKINYLFAGILDFKYLLNSGLSELEANLINLTNEYPNLEYIASTTRVVTSPVEHEISVNLFTAKPKNFIQTKSEKINVIDRIGTGDAFSAGILHGILSAKSDFEIANLGLACNVLVHYENGDNYPLAKTQVENFYQLGSTEIKR